MRFRVMMLVVVFLLLGACAGPKTRAVVSSGDRSIQMKAENFKFDPSIIQTSPGELLLHVENVSNNTHNITVKDPSGNTLASADLPPKSTTDVSVRLEKPGNYELFCDKPGHSTLGMKGRIEVVAP